jgi:hypothetical protein
MRALMPNEGYGERREDFEHHRSLSFSVLFRLMYRSSRSHKCSAASHVSMGHRKLARENMARTVDGGKRSSLTQR